MFHVSGKGFTNSLDVALPAATYGGGDTASKPLEKTNLFTSKIGLPLPPVPGYFNVIRLGTQEINVRECTQKIWKRLPTFFAACC